MGAGKGETGPKEQRPQEGPWREEWRWEGLSGKDSERSKGRKMGIKAGRPVWLGCGLGKDSERQRFTGQKDSGY